MVAKTVNNFSKPKMRAYGQMEKPDLGEQENTILKS